jgi:hypothetical protein
MYAYSGLLAVQQLVDQFILNSTVATTAGANAQAPASIRPSVLDFPSPSYKQVGVSSS